MVCQSSLVERAGECWLFLELTKSRDIGLVGFEGGRGGGGLREEGEGEKRGRGREGEEGKGGGGREGERRRVKRERE